MTEYSLIVVSCISKENMLYLVHGFISKENMLYLVHGFYV
ncbi:hypothetical protein M6B38_198195 [Iris pallida]|uniref:Uncharacterized protein n=1 Tax=Iris pallida TaxID=29817 RepID=A0AAX6EC36_IRIPA|nr:hypothetical protein M6B38_198195 [Iris pallida]